MWISVLRRLHPKRRGSDAVAIGGVADHRRLPSDRGIWPSKLAAMIMRRVGLVNSCHRPLPGYALALTMSVRAPGCRRGCGWAGGPGGEASRSSSRYRTWPRDQQTIFIRVAHVIRLRSRLDRPGRSHTSPNSTRSLRSTRAGTMSRTWSRADEGCCGAMAYPFLLGWPSCGYPSFVDYIPSAGRSDAVAVGGVADHLCLPSDRGTWPSKLAAMIMRRVGRVNSCRRPLPGYNERARRRGCGRPGGEASRSSSLTTHQIRKGDQPENRCCICARPLVARRDASLRRIDWVAIGGIADMPKSVAKVRMRRN